MAVPVHLFLTNGGGLMIYGITHLYKEGDLLVHDAWNERPTT